MQERIDEDILPNALMIGVQYDLFWSLNPKSLAPFIRAFTLRQKHEDVLAWQQGSYIRMAITSSFNDKVKYPVNPLSQSAVNEISPEKQQEIIKERFLRHVQLINKKFER